MVDCRKQCTVYTVLFFEDDKGLLGWLVREAITAKAAVQTALTPIPPPLFFDASPELFLLA